MSCYIQRLSDMQEWFLCSWDSWGWWNQRSPTSEYRLGGDVQDGEEMLLEWRDIIRPKRKTLIVIFLHESQTPFQSKNPTISNTTICCNYMFHTNDHSDYDGCLVYYLIAWLHSQARTFHSRFLKTSAEYCQAWESTAWQASSVPFPFPQNTTRARCLRHWAHWF
jgi:hypothetical protein